MSPISNLYIKDIVRIFSNSFPLDIASINQEFPNDANCIQQN